MLLAYTYPVLSIFWSMLIFFGFVVWFYLLFLVFADLFRDPVESGWGKAAWTMFVLFFPLVGVLVYLIARGQGMMQRSEVRAEQQQAAVDEYIRRVAKEDETKAAAKSEEERTRQQQVS